MVVSPDEAASPDGEERDAEEDDDASGWRERLRRRALRWGPVKF